MFIPGGSAGCVKRRGVVINRGSYEIPGDYSRFFKDRVIIITGVGKSGTSILGKLIGSMVPTYYFYEPSVMQLLTFLTSAEPENVEVHAQMLRAVFFEDHLLQLVHGRTANFNPDDESFISHYTDVNRARKIWSELVNRTDAVELLDRERPWIVIKTPEYQPLMNVAKIVFPGVRYVHIIRDGNSVIGSSKAREWYSDDYLNDDIVAWTHSRKSNESANTPWYFSGTERDRFPHWNLVTREASVWRVLTQYGIDYCENNPSTTLEISYEGLVENPSGIVDEIIQFAGLKRSDITEKHIKTIGKFRRSAYRSISTEIAPEQRVLYSGLMTRLGYAP